jgi:PAS domain-containing protein
MPRSSETWSVCALFSVVIAWLAAGCAAPVREDRTIEFTRDGRQVAFQHGREGVYVADREGGEVIKVFEPAENVVATSRPLASPTDGRIIFTTAEPHAPSAHRQLAADAPAPADGQIVWAMPVRVTCWLREESSAESPAGVRRLFTAACGHPGYVSAGLAVRWQPHGNSVLYVAMLEDGSGKHSVFEHDLRSGRSSRVFPHAGDAIVCDLAPGGSYLVCVVGNRVEDQAAGAERHGASGIWIGRPADASSWWHVPGSHQPARGELPSLLEMLRASRPAWKHDESQFAFVSWQPGPTAELADRHRLQRVDFSSRSIDTVAESEGRITDVHWSPDGQRLGFVTRDPFAPARVRIVHASGPVVDVAAAQSIRRFAGFDASGEHLAYVVASPIEPPIDGPWWALLLRPDAGARDSVWVASADGFSPGTELFSGMRVTFPHWSPTENRLSLWLTFTPRYQSLLTALRRWGLWPGDPAATLDVRSGAIAWLAVTPQEELQIGHYYLLKRDYTEAWRWYEQARRKLPAARPPRDWQEFARRIGSPDQSQVFEFLCLKRMGRVDEAAARWLEFEQTFFPQAAAQPADPSQSSARDATDQLLSAPGPHAELLRRLVHELYAAEVFLSVDALDDALEHFGAEPVREAGDEAALSRSLVAAQLRLIARDHAGYLAHCTDVVAPQALGLWEAGAAAAPPAAGSHVLSMACGLCLAPLFHPEFVRGLPEPAVRDYRPKWEEYRDGLDDGLPAIAVDLVLRAAALKCGDMAAAEAAHERIRRNPAASELFGQNPIDDVIASWWEWSHAAADQL